MRVRQKLVVMAGVAMLLSLVPVRVGALKCGAGSARAGETVENAADCNVPKAGEGQTLNGTVENVIAILMAALGMIAVVVIIYGAVQMVISQGDPGKVKTARNAVIYGVVGLIVAILAWAIVTFVLGSISI